MKIGVTSQNKLKIDAVKDAYAFMRPTPTIVGYNVASGVGEQPINEQTLIGAKNRINELREKVNDLDVIVSIESGIFQENNKWIDKAIVVIYYPYQKKEYVGYSDGIVFPDEYVNKARQIGFDKITVAKVMADDGFISNPKDPHLTISGTPRQVFIKNTTKKLVDKIEKL